MPVNLTTPAGVEYTRQHTEYQHFPEEFFSGADLVIYFGDVWLADLTRLQFTLTEATRPVYGYASYTWDVFKRGARVIQGEFAIAFREAGYLYRVLDHLGQLNEAVVPTVGQLAMGGQGVPQWHADALQTIEETIKHWDQQGASGVSYFVLHPGEYELTPRDRAIMPARLLGQKLGVRVDWDDANKQVLFNGRAFVPYRIDDPGVAWVYVREVSEFCGFRVEYDAATGIITVASAGAIVLLPKDYRLINDRACLPARKLGSLLGLDVRWDEQRGEAVVNGTYFTPALVENGTAWLRVREVGETFRYLVEWVPETGAVIIVSPKAAEGPATSRFTRDMQSYVDQIWASSGDEQAAGDRKRAPYFYSGKNMARLREQGFDIFIVYGPLPYDVKQRKNQLPELVSYDTTVKALRNIQLTGVSQVLDASGRPVEEVYTFVAQDLD